MNCKSKFTKGPEGNFSEYHIDDWIDQIVKVSPELVQIYSLNRPSPTDSLIKLNEGELMSIQTRLTKVNIRSQIYP